MRANYGMPFLWTEERIHAHLALSMAIYQRTQLGAQQIAEVRQAGIRRIELSSIPRSLNLGDRQQLSDILRACERQGVTIVSVHGPFRLPYGSEDEEARQLVVRESLAAIRCAETVGASIYVAHFGYGEHSRRTVCELLRRTDGFRIKLTTENGKDLRDYMAIVDRIGSDRFGLTVDIGHARDSDGVNPFVRKDRARATLAQCGDRLFHIHLHETFDLEQQADHRAPLHDKGIIEWGEIFAALAEIGYSGELVFEDGRGENPQEWIRATAAFPHAFIQRYGQDGPAS